VSGIFERSTNMRKRCGNSMLALCGILVLLLWQTTFAEEPASPQIELAKTFVSQMAAGEFEKAVEPFDARMQKAIPAEKLKQIWNSVTNLHGAFRKTGASRTEVAKPYQIVYVTLEFERGQHDAKVVFNADNKVAGLFFIPSGKYQSPPYVKPAAFESVEMKIGKGVLPLSGTLALPKGKGQFPVVILVHG
jgi:hypothetical protein